MNTQLDDLSLTEAADEAFSRGQLPEALAGYTHHLEQDPTNLYCWYITAFLLGRVGEREASQRSLARAATALAESGRLLLALAACRNLAEINALAGKAKVKEIAALYGSGSERLEPKRRTLPPPLPERVNIDDDEDEEPLSTDIGELRQKGLAACKEAASQWQARDRGQKSKVPYHPLFSELSPADFAALVPVLELRMFPASKVVIEQGEEGRSFFILVHGGVSVIHRSDSGEDVHLATLGQGAFFGEMALLTDSPRVAKVFCLHPTVLFEVNKGELEKLASRSPGVAAVLANHTRGRMLRNVMCTSPLFRLLDRERQKSLRRLFQTRVFNIDQDIITEGEEPEGLHLILSGLVRVTRKEGGEELTLAELGAGQIFGEMSVIQRKPATATVTAISKTVVLFLARDTFNEHISEFPELLAHIYKITVEREQANIEIDSSPIEQVDENALLI